MKNSFNLQLFAEKVSLTSGNDTLFNQKVNRIIYALGENDYVTNRHSHRSDPYYYIISRKFFKVLTSQVRN